MDKVITGIAVISFLLGLFFCVNAILSSPDTVLQQIYLALEWVKALLAFLLFTVCALYARLADTLDKKTKSPEAMGVDITS